MMFLDVCAVKADANEQHDDAVENRAAYDVNFILQC